MFPQYFCSFNKICRYYNSYRLVDNFIFLQKYRNNEHRNQINFTSTELYPYFIFFKNVIQYFINKCNSNISFFLLYLGNPHCKIH